MPLLSDISFSLVVIISNQLFLFPLSHLYSLRHRLYEHRYTPSGLIDCRICIHRFSTNNRNNKPSSYLLRTAHDAAGFRFLLSLHTFSSNPIMFGNHSRHPRLVQSGRLSLSPPSLLNSAASHSNVGCSPQSATLQSSQLLDSYLPIFKLGNDFIEGGVVRTLSHTVVNICRYFHPLNHLAYLISLVL